MSNPKTLHFKIELTTIDCGECGGTYAINERYREQQYEKGGSWNCPYCRVGWGYSDNNENSILKAQLKAAERGRELALRQAENSRNQARAQKAAKTRLKNRIKNGVCPCCNRHFNNLHEHIKNQHPGYGNQKK